MSAQKHLSELFPWLTSSFVQNMIERSEQRNDVVLKSFNAEKCFNKGEGFSSYMIAVTALFRYESTDCEKESNILLKIALRTDDFRKMCEECLIYEREIEAYTVILPAVKNLFESVGVSADIAPRCYFSDSAKQMLVFEDMRYQNYRIVRDRAHGLDMEHMKLTLVNLAKWHASTATLLLTNIELFQWYKKKILYKNAINTENFIKDVAKTLSCTVKNWPGYEGIASQLDNIPQEAYDNIYKSYIPQEGGFNVITHGDMFINNLLFRYDQSGKPIDIRFVDFPLGQHATPSNDLVRLLYGSAHSSIGWEDREHLIQYYHSKLVTYLKRLRFPGRIPTLLEIQIESIRTDFYNALLILFIIGLRFINESFEGGFIEVVSDERANDSGKLYSHPECIKQMKLLLDIFDRRGYFEF